MFDRRYPYLFRLSDLPGATPEERALLGDFADRVRARTDFEAVYNAKSGRLFFYISDPTQGAALPDEFTRFRTGPRSFDLTVADRVDDLCRTLQTGRMSMAQKDRLLANAKQSRLTDEESRRNRVDRPEAIHAIREELKRNKVRLGMSSRFRPHVLVNGLKGGL